MARPKVYQSNAVILRQRKLGEADRILTLFSPIHGKFDAVAKGVRKPTSRMGGHVEVLSYVNVLVAVGQNLDIVTQAQTIEGFARIRGDLPRLTHALYAAELIDRFTDQREENPDLFRLLMETLGQLQEMDELDLSLRYFEMRLLSLLGYQPQLQQCVHCSASLAPGQNYWSANAGGMLCPACQSHEGFVRPVSLTALKVMRLMQRAPFAEVARVRVSDALMSEIERSLREYIRFLLERDVRSATFLDTVRADDVATRRIATA